MTRRRFSDDVWGRRRREAYSYEAVASLFTDLTRSPIGPPTTKIYFDPAFVASLVDAQEESALEALCLHELLHVLRYLRGFRSQGTAEEEIAVNQMMRELGFGHDQANLKRVIGCD